MGNFSMRAGSRVLFFIHAICSAVLGNPRKSQLGLLLTSVLALLLVPISTKAGTVSNVVSFCNASVSDLHDGTGNAQSCGGGEANASWTSGFDGDLGLASAVISNGPPGLMVSASTHFADAATTAGAGASITYNFIATPVQQYEGPAIPSVLGLLAGSLTSMASDSSAGSWSATVSVQGQGVPIFSLNYQNATTNVSVPIDVIDSIDLNVVYTVTLFGNVTITSFRPNGCSSNCQASVNIDPTITIDPDDPNAANVMLTFSPGIDNSEDGSATPLPATFPLFATGFAGLGLLGWRRKRKNAAALAA
jgi:hypothetical protein